MYRKSKQRTASLDENSGGPEATRSRPSPGLRTIAGGVLIYPACSQCERGIFQNPVHNNQSAEMITLHTC